MSTVKRGGQAPALQIQARAERNTSFPRRINLALSPKRRLAYRPWRRGLSAMVLILYRERHWRASLGGGLHGGDKDFRHAPPVVGS